MKTLLIPARWAALGAMALTACSLPPSVPVAAAAPDNELVQGNSAFACALYRKLSEEPGNLFLSPYSISSALAMTYAGAAGVTEKEMAQALHFGKDQRGIASGFKKLQEGLSAIDDNGKVMLSIANSLWPQEDYELRDEYLSLMRSDFKAAVKPVNYRTGAEGARTAINGWVEAKTQNKIKDLVPPGMLQAMTRLVLVNAIYFKGQWASQFKPEETKTAPFHLSAGRSVPAPLMFRKEELGYAVFDWGQMLELPYSGEELSMLILLPKEAGGLRGLEAALSAEELDTWKTSLRKREVRVYLPKFKMTAMFELSKVLSSLGMPSAFMPTADFRGMTGTLDLFISAVLHKAFVEVTEEGTEAAAATAVTMMRKAAFSGPPEFRADRPFLFVIQEKKTGSVLFLGRLADPTSSAD